MWRYYPSAQPSRAIDPHANVWTHPRMQRFVILGLVCLATLVGSSPDLTGVRIAQLAAPYRWGAVGWEAEHLAEGAGEIANQLFHPSDDQSVVADVRALLQSARAGPVGGDRRVSSLVAGVVAFELRRHGAPSLGRVVVPPVTLALTQPLQLLVVSPRDEIRESYWALLEGGTPSTVAPVLEKAVEDLGVSALVVDRIAIATYPTLIPVDTSPAAILQTAAHEWTHTALFFTRLGQAYGSSPSARAINETTADIVGAEIGDALDRNAGIGTKTEESQARDRAFTARMRAIRQRVDVLLAEHEVDRAEAYMEEQRLLLVSQGYRIRRLNQAYFAFFGNYAEGPSATTEIVDSVRAIRDRSGTLADFLGEVGQVTTIEELRGLVARKAAR